MIDVEQRLSGTVRDVGPGPPVAETLAHVERCARSGSGDVSVQGVDAVVYVQGTRRHVEAASLIVVGERAVSQRESGGGSRAVDATVIAGCRGERVTGKDAVGEEPVRNRGSIHQSIGGGVAGVPRKQATFELRAGLRRVSVEIRHRGAGRCAVP